MNNLPAFQMGLLACHISVIGCGPTVEVNRTPPTLGENAAPSLTNCNAPLLVPAGDVWLGPIDVDEQGNLQKDSCDDDNVGSAHWQVGDVFIDADEVTNACYRHCVNAGACSPPISPIDPEAPNLPNWTDPTIADFPAILDQERAEAFCAFRGGRLASVAELARAMQGSVLGVAQPEMYEAWESCYAEGFTSPECIALESHVQVPGKGPMRPLRPIRSEPRDIGPYGHYDLFGSQGEFSATMYPPDKRPKEWCMDGITAPLTFSTLPDAVQLCHVPGHNLAYEYQLISIEGIAFSTFSYGMPSTSLSGARCAYDVAP